MFSNLFPENRAVYEITWENIVDLGRPQMTVWRMCIACWIPKTTNTYLVIFHSKNCGTKAPQRYVLRSLPVLLNVKSDGTYSNH